MVARVGEAASRSGLLEAASESAEGMVVARAFGQQALFEERFRRQLAINAAWNDSVAHIKAWLQYM
jgi:hypothetical protein